MKAMKNYRMMAMALVAVLILGFSNSTFANTDPDAPAELKFLGSDNNLPVFQLVLNNSTAGDYIIKVKDGDKKVLLIEKLSGENIVRRYKLDTDEISLIEGTTFEVTNKKTNETAVYGIKSNTIFFQNIVVAKL